MTLRDRISRAFGRIRDGINFVLPREAPAREKPPSELERQQATAREKVDRYRATFNERANELAGQVAAGEIEPRVFRAQMLTEIRMMVLTAVAAGVGGVGKLTNADLQRIDDKVKEQARYLDRWIADIERTPVEKRSAGQMQTRARMYGGAGTAVADEAVDKGLFREFPDLPFRPADRTNCYNNCKCRWSWQNVDHQKGNADVYWRLAPAEHCETCLTRAEVCNPLRIRDWKIVTKLDNPALYRAE